MTNEQMVNVTNLGLKLNGLGIKALFSSIEEGPVVTAYLFKLDASVPLSKILKKGEDFALALNADKVIIQRVGDKIAVFIPNKDRKIVDFKEFLHWYLNDETVAKQVLPIPLGVDFHGVKTTMDLADAPHVLITGSTGSGKSVLEAAIICALAYKYDSSALHFYLVDTKKVDLPLFSSLPHTQIVADDLDKFHNMMSGIMIETRRRLSLLQGASVRKIQEYHRMGYTLPYIVIMLDEFGDLMDIDSLARKAGQYEDTPTVRQWIKSIAQIGRAAGVHLIAGTQRASVRVVDGDIKVNLPCRISLRLPTGIDSRIILGVNGAENLLGKGDMLVQRPEKDIVERFHGPFVASNDIAELVGQYSFLKDILNK